jgi:CrcB protein
MRTWLWVAAGSALGGVGRHAVSLLMEQRLGDRLPYGTLLVNVLGSLAIGVIAGMAESPGRYAPSHELRLFLVPGLLGGFTTFSAFSLQSVGLLRSHQGLAVLYIGASLALCLAAAYGGFAAGVRLAR